MSLLHNVFCWKVKLYSSELSLEAYSLGFMSRQASAVNGFKLVKERLLKMFLPFSLHAQ